MSFQVCPLCQGKGGGLVECCPVCLNKLVIDDKTGRPPTIEKTPVLESITTPQAQSNKPEDLVAPMSVFEEPTDEEILYYATPYYDELQANKAEMARRKKEGTVTDG